MCVAKRVQRKRTQRLAKMTPCVQIPVVAVGDDALRRKDALCGFAGLPLYLFDRDLSSVNQGCDDSLKEQIINGAPLHGQHFDSCQCLLQLVAGQATAEQD